MKPAVTLVGEGEATGELKAIYEELTKALGFVPNTFKAMGRTPKFLEAMVQLDAAARIGGEIPQKYKELICLAVAAANGCQYCLYAHTALAKEAGASERERAEALALAAMMSAFNTYNKATGLEIDIKP